MRAQEIAAANLGDAGLRLLAEAQLAPHVDAARAEAQRLREHGASWWQRHKQRARLGRLIGTAKWLRDPRAQRRSVIVRQTTMMAVVSFVATMLLRGDFDLQSAVRTFLIVLPGALVVGLLSWASTEPAYVSTLHDLGLADPNSLTR